MRNSLRLKYIGVARVKKKMNLNTKILRYLYPPLKVGGLAGYLQKKMDKGYVVGCEDR